MRKFLQALLVLSAAANILNAQTAFTYQGLLKVAGNPALTATQLRFQLFDSASGGSQVGGDVNTTVTPTNGIFTTQLDFGAIAFTGPDRFLQISVVTNGGATVIPLTPRQYITSAPYAIYSYYTRNLLLPFSGSGNRNGNASAVFNISNTDGTGTGIYGSAGGSYGFNFPGAGIWGDGNAADGVHGTSSTGIGVYGYGLTNTGVYGRSDSGYGVDAYSNTGYALSAFSGSTAVYASSNNGSAYAGTAFGAHTISVSNSGNFDGVYASSVTANGIEGYTTANGGKGGVYGQSNGSGGNGVYGFCTGTNGNGVIGSSSVGALAYGIYGYTTSGYAGYFYGKTGINGNLNVVGTLSKGSGTFKIDHPLDPANKFLYHSFVESPDMMNIYNGNVMTDAKGEAWIELPSYFEALNQDFRYQLTIVDETQFAQARVAKKIVGNRFMIKTDKPSIEVSWQVTGVRHDAFANAHRVVPEVNKAADEKGFYLHPAENGQPEAMGIEYQRKLSKESAPK